MPRHIAIVEDEDALALNYRDAFQRQGYKVSHYKTRREALDGMLARLPDLVIIDVGLKGEPEGGFDLCRELRSHSPELPLVFLTARTDDFDVISGLRLGADDYLTKDISLAHLQARVTALFRRIEALKQPLHVEQFLDRGSLRLDLDRMVVAWQGQAVALTITELWMVHALVLHPGHLKNRQQLMDAANVVLDDNTITSHIKRIRRKFKDSDPSFDCIKTAYGMGYRWQEAD